MSLRDKITPPIAPWGYGRKRGSDPEKKKQRSAPMESSYQPATNTALPPIDSDVAQLLREVLAPELDPFDPEEVDAIMEEAQRGNAAAQYILGVALESLEPPRIKEACDWYRLAADQGYSPAKAKLRPHRVQ